MIKIQLLIVSLVFFCCSIAIAQNTNCIEISGELESLKVFIRKLAPEQANIRLDSIEGIIPVDCNESKIQFYNLKGHYYMSQGEFDLAEREYQSSLKNVVKGINNEAKYRKRIAGYLSEFFTNKEDYQKGLIVIEEALKIPCHEDSLKCQKANIALLINSSINLQRLDRYNEAIERYEKAEFRMNKYDIKDSVFRTSILNQMGKIYNTEFNDFEESLSYYKKAANYVPAAHKGRFLIFNNIGFRYADLEKFDSAYYYFNKTINSKSPSKYLITAYQGLAAISVRGKDYKAGIENYGKALDNAKKSKRTSMIYRCRVYMAKTHFLNGDFEKSQSYLEKAIESRKGKDIPERQKSEMDLYSHLLSVASLDSDLSYELYQDFLNYDTIAINQQAKSLNKSVSKYEKILLKDSLDREVLLKENETQKAKNYRLSTLSLFLGLLLAGGVAYQFRRLLTGSRAKNEELVFKNQELETLNQQLESKTKSIDIKQSSNQPVIAAKIQFKSADKVYLLEPDQVKYIKAEDDGTRVYFDDTSKWTDMSLKDIGTLFPEDTFVQIFRSTIVNINHIGWVNSTSLKMKDGTELKISRTYKQKIKDAVIGNVS